MFERIVLTVSDLDASRRFYETVLGPDLGELELREGPDVTRGVHLGFAARSREAVDAFWRAGVDAGYPDDGAPGPRPQYTPDYYGGFLLDPDGNSAEAVHHGDVRPGVDHVWLRVADLGASAAFYRALPGVRVVRELAGQRVTFDLEGGTFSIVTDGRPVTEHLAWAFAGPEPESLTDPDGNVVEIVAR